MCMERTLSPAIKHHAADESASWELDSSSRPADLTPTASTSTKNPTDLPMWLYPMAESISKESAANAAVDTDSVSSSNAVYVSIEEPAVSLPRYMWMLWTTFRSPRVWGAAVVLLRRFTAKTGLPVTPFTAHRLVLTSVVAAAHTLIPGSFNFSSAAESGGVELNDLLEMVGIFLRVLSDCTATTSAESAAILKSGLESKMGQECERSVLLAALLVEVEEEDTDPNVRMRKWLSGLEMPPAEETRRIKRGSDKLSMVLALKMQGVGTKLSRLLRPKTR